ncbi:hypothetical protein ACFE04_024115 [Oxalis oulophora]
MCGIAVVISGSITIQWIDSSSSSPITVLDSSNSQQPCGRCEQLLVSIDDIKAALRRRGPDSLGQKKLFLNDSTNVELNFIGATLQLRGNLNPVIQPITDSFGNLFVYNGEIFGGGISVHSDSNDTEVLMQTLANCCSCNSHHHTQICNNDNGKTQKSVVDVLSIIKGPWALIYWQSSSKTLWFGRDAFGRRSLLVHWPTLEDSRFLLSSVSPLSSTGQSTDLEAENKASSRSFWEELSCGIYSLCFHASPSIESPLGEVKKHEWNNSELEGLIRWERCLIEPKPEQLQTPNSVRAHTVLSALKESVMRRTSRYRIFQTVRNDNRHKEFVPVAVLFSGGLDSMILAALLDECLDPSYEIDLLNVSFDGQAAPDRITARSGLDELIKIAPLRRWNLVEIDADLSTLSSETKHVISLINPSNTYMDLNIGIALWLAADGKGWLYKGMDYGNNYNNDLRVKYKSEARVLLVGSGADEQCAGYGRHRTKYRNGGWVGLYEEMKLDMQRIWKRNLGRDDRCIADTGKEARFPFLDEDVIKTLLDIPLWEITDLNQQSGIGDKKILREVAHLLGLHKAAVLPKRAIQFGSRIAKESNRKNFGSNRAANQASAGSVVFNLPK